MSYNSNEKDKSEYTGMVVTDDIVIDQLKQVIKELKKDTFQGIFLYSNQKDEKGFLRSNMGTVQDRVALIHMIFREMDTKDPEVLAVFHSEVYPLFKIVFANQYDHEKNKNKVNGLDII